MVFAAFYAFIQNVGRKMLSIFHTELLSWSSYNFKLVTFISKRNLAVEMIFLENEDTFFNVVFLTELWSYSS